MAHRIFGQRFLTRSAPAWHGLGIVFGSDEVISPQEAVKRVAGDIHVIRQPLYYGLPGEDGAKRMSEHYAIIRLPTPEDANPMVFGTTSERWVPKSYPELASALDRMDASIYKVETAGLLEGGQLCFIALRGEDWSVLGIDAMKTYFLVNLSLKPGVGHRVLHVTERVVCHNTNEIAINTSRIDLRVRHGADAAQQIGLAGDLIMRFRRAQDEAKEIFETFAKTPAPPDIVSRIHDAAWPVPDEPKQVRLLRNVIGSDEAMITFQRGLDAAALQGIMDAQERHERAKETILELKEAGQERFAAFQPAALRGTVHAAYQSVTEVADWRGNGKSAAESVLIGSRAGEKARAFGEAMKVCAID